VQAHGPAVENGGIAHAVHVRMPGPMPSVLTGPPLAR